VQQKSNAHPQRKRNRGKGNKIMQYLFDTSIPLEEHIQSYLTSVRLENPLAYRVPVFTLYTELKEALLNSNGKTFPKIFYPTRYFKTWDLPVAVFNKTVGDMKRAGIIGTCKGGEEVFLSNAAFLKTNKTDNRLKVYLAGRIRANDWRHKIVVNLRNDSHSASDWRKIDQLRMQDGNTYVGPFFIGCDHKCFHGSNGHGAGAGWKEEDGCSGDIGPTKQEVFARSFKGIAACDLFFVWAGIDFAEAYGTLVEIGLARALGKKIVIAKHPDLTGYDQWFAQCAATSIIVNNDPVAAYADSTNGSTEGGL
jgi:hypothetical protein